MGNRRCAAEGCNALEFRSEGWCHRHKDDNETLLPANAPNWWEEQPEPPSPLATPPLQPAEEEEYRHTPHPIEYSIRDRINQGVLALFFIIAIFTGPLADLENRQAVISNGNEGFNPGTPGSGLTQDTYTNPWNDCSIVMYDAWWEYYPVAANDSGDLVITWDADINFAVQSRGCPIGADMYATITIETASDSETVRVLTKAFSTYSDNWDNISVHASADGLPGQMVDGTYTISILVTGTHTIYRTNAPLFLQASITVGEDSTTGSLCTDHPCGVLS